MTATPDGPHLLVIDWDYFFANPCDGGEYRDPQVLLYDWGHIENDFHVTDVWPHRAQGFLTHGLELPGVSGYTGFWDRFRLAEGVELAVCDSNAYAGLVQPSAAADADEFASVWLYDAHHDAGYHNSTLDAWRESGQLSCENWMIDHHEAGASLHVRYPTWKVHAFSAEPTPWVPVDRAIDDGSTPPVTFDRVLLCRSGAWVPPWCDQDFAAFVEQFPGPSCNVDPAYPDLVREFDRAAVDALVAALHEHRHLLTGSPTTP